MYLTSLPIVNDESMYLHWGNQFLSHWSNPAMPISLQGKQALTAITLGLAQRLPMDPLIAARLVTLLLSLVGLSAFISVARRVLRPADTVTAVLLVATSPLLVFFQRLALPDAAVAASYMCALWMWFRLIDKPTILRAIYLGVCIAIGWWYKSSALLAIPPLIISSLIILAKNRSKDHYILILYTCVSIMLALFGTVLATSFPPLNRIVPLAQTEHVYTLTQLFQFPWNVWARNAGITLQMLMVFSAPFAVMFPLFLLTKRKLNTSEWIIILWAISPLIVEIFLARINNGRYLVIAMMPMIIVISMGLETLGRWKKLISLCCVATSMAISVLLITRPLAFYQLTTPLPAVKSDLSQYMLGWSSGWGVREAADYLATQARDHSAVVFVRADSGNPEDAMYVYLFKSKNITVLPITYLDQAIGTTKQTSGISYYFVSRGTQMAGLDEKAVLIKRFNKPTDEEFVGVHQVKTLVR